MQTSDPHPLDPLFAKALQGRPPVGACLSQVRLAVFAAGQVDEATRAAFLIHMGRCRKCADALLQIRAAVPAPRASRTPTPRPVRLAPRVIRPRSSWAAAVVAAVLLAAVGVGAWFAHKQAQQTGPQQVAQPTPKPQPRQPEPPQEVVQQPTPPEPETPKEPDDLVLDPKSPDPQPQPPVQTPPEEHATKPPDPEPPAQQPPLAPTAPKEQPFDLASLLGGVEVQPAGKTAWQRVPEGQTFKAEGRLALRAGGSKAARVSFAGRTLSLEKNSEIAIANFERDCELTLSRGSLLVDARGAGEKGTTLDVAGARVGGKARRFAASVQNRQGRVTAFDGEVAVESGGQATPLPNGLSCAFLEGKAAGDPAKADVASLLAWTRDLEVFVSTEAEKASKVLPPMRVKSDSNASGGSYVTSNPRERGDGPGSIEVVFEAKRAGTWRFFMRAATGVREKGAFAVAIDGGEAHELAVRGRGDAWGWSGMDGVELTAGRHVLRLADPRGGLRLDTLIFTTDPLFHPDPGAEEEPQGDVKPPRDPKGGPNPGGDNGGRHR